jgi:hypothetical protein
LKAKATGIDWKQIKERTGERVVDANELAKKYNMAGVEHLP